MLHKHDHDQLVLATARQEDTWPGCTNHNGVAVPLSVLPLFHLLGAAVVPPRL